LGLVNNELEVNVEGTKLSIPKDKIAKVKKVFEF
jgi:hypothetical protein